MKQDIGCGGRRLFIIRVTIDKAGANCTCLCDLSDDRLEKYWKFNEETQPI